MKSPLILVLYIAFALPAFTQNTGGGNLNPGLKANTHALEKFQDMRIGLSIHWGPSSLGVKRLDGQEDKKYQRKGMIHFTSNSILLPLMQTNG